jgi:hypothetical protein
VVSYPQMIPVTRSNITQVSFYLSLGSRTQYSVYANATVDEQESSPTQSAVVNYLPLQGESWQIAIRFY